MIPTVPVQAEIARRLISLPSACRWEEIGASRDGRPIFGIEAGTGPFHVSITAGAHSDEPAGPLAALAIAESLDRRLLEKATWRICPHVNPDGAERNAPWFADPPDPLTYARHAFREGPGEDVEFNYPPAVPEARSPRPENETVARFLRGAAPYHFHISLHGMGFAEGAWWLIGRDSVDATAGLRPKLERLFHEAGLPLHDVDRDGEKGFFRIAPGFGTTPTSVAMREFFHQQGDPETAARFLPSSMEFVQSLGGRPVVMVSELPIFLIEGDYFGFRKRYVIARAGLEAGDEAKLRALFDEFHVRAIPFATQVEILRKAVLETVEFLLHHPVAPAGA